MNKMMDLGLDIRSKKRTAEAFNAETLLLENQTSQDSLLSGFHDLDDVAGLLQGFPSDDLIESYSINAQVFLNDSNQPSSEQFEISLKTLKPDKVIMLEPTLEFIRALELYNAEKQISC